MKLLFSVAVALTMITGSVMAQQKGRGWAAEPESMGWFLLRAKAVQNDLGLSDEVASKLDAGVIVTVFPDSADKYLSERFWDER